MAVLGALFFQKQALDFQKQALFFQKQALDFQKQALDFQKQAFGCVYCRALQKDIDCIHLDMEGCLGSNHVEGQGSYEIFPADADCRLCVICRTCHGYEGVPFLPASSCRLLAYIHVTSCRGTSEKNPMVGKLWVMVAAMVLFFYAQVMPGCGACGCVSSPLPTMPWLGCRR